VTGLLAWRRTRNHNSHVELGRRLATLARSAAAGAAASLTDLAVLAALVQLAHVSPRTASVPALLVGAVVMFFGQKRIAFHSRSKVTLSEAFLFAVVQIGGLALTALLFEVALRIGPDLADHYVIVRLVASNVVWLFYSFPLWSLVFRVRRSAATNASAAP